MTFTADEVVALDESTCRIEEEAAVEVAVPGNTEVGAGGAHRVSRSRPVLGQKGVWNAVREAAVGIPVQAHEVERQVLGEPVDNRPCTAVPRVDHNLEWGEGACVDVGEQSVHIGLFRVQRFPRPSGCALRPGRARHRVADLGESRVVANRLRLLPDQLHPVVIRGIVACCHDHAAV